MMDIPLIATDPEQGNPHTHTVVFLHGRGDRPENFVGALSRWCDSRGLNLAECYPTFRWVFPRAPTRACASSPAVVMPQWFDVWSTTDFYEREDLAAEGLKEVIPGILRILADEAAKLGGSGKNGYDRVVLAGISMGGATSVHTLFNLVDKDVPRLAAFMGFSARCPFAGRTLSGMREALGLLESPDDAAGDSEVLRNTPMLLEHCADDPLVLIRNGHLLRDTLRGFGAQVEWKEYPIGKHWFKSPEGMDDVVDFLNKHVLAQTEGQKPGGPSTGAMQLD